MRCPDCGLEKAPEEFPRNRSARSGLGAYCKPCHNARGRESKQRLYGGHRHYRLRDRYGIGAAEVQALVDAQGGLCKVCCRNPALQVDHDHDTGVIRGILCDGCNGGLGLFNEDIQLLQRAIEYLEKKDG